MNLVMTWWAFLELVSAVNIAAWVVLWLRLGGRIPDGKTRLMAWLSLGYVLACAYRSVMPRIDVSRTTLVESWLSNVLLGRSAATIGELCFAAQWALLLSWLGASGKSSFAKTAAWAVVPLIAVAELFSWYAVATTNYLGSAIEESVWAGTFFLVAAALLASSARLKKMSKWTVRGLAAGIAAYLLFMVTVDIPMYVMRWQAAQAAGITLLAPVAGLRDMATHWTVAFDVSLWQPEMLWMVGYFSLAVWVSLFLWKIFSQRDHLLSLDKER